MSDVPLTERQEQALRGLRLCERAFAERHPEPDKRPGREKWWSAGSVGDKVDGELPEFHQHGRGAMGPSSWSGTVPNGRIMGPALKALCNKGLAERQEYWEYEDHQRSAKFRLTARGRKRANALLAAVGS